MPVKFKPTLKKNPLQQGSAPKYYPTIVTEGEFTLKELAKRVADTSSFSEGDLLGLLPTILKIIPQELATGKIVRLGDLGSLRITVKGEGSDTEDKVTISNIKSVGVVFTPGKDLKKAVNDIEFSRAVK